MKDSVLLDGKIYISSRRAAEISHYTTDYVGQLCRAGKVDCRIVGRAWFVTEESLLKHQAFMANSLTNGLNGSNSPSGSSASNGSVQKNPSPSVPTSLPSCPASPATQNIPSIFSLAAPVKTTPSTPSTRPVPLVSYPNSTEKVTEPSSIKLQKDRRDEPSRILETAKRPHFFRTAAATVFVVLSLVLLGSTVMHGYPQLADALAVPASGVMNQFVNPVISPMASGINQTLKNTPLPADYASASDALAYAWNGFIGGISSGVLAVLDFGTVNGGGTSPVRVAASATPAGSGTAASSSIAYERTTTLQPIVTDNVTNKTLYLTDPSVEITLSSLQNQIDAEKNLFNLQVDSLARNIGQTVIVSGGSSNSGNVSGSGGDLTGLNASNITSGVLAVAYGGTGFSSASTSSFFLTDASGNPYTGTTTPAFTLGGAVVGNNQNLTGLNQLVATGVSAGSANAQNVVASTSLTLPYLAGFGSMQCLQIDANGVVSATGAACGNGGGGSVNVVSNSDGTLTISPTTGSVVASLNLSHANAWIGAQTFAATSTFASTTFNGPATLNGQVAVKNNFSVSGTTTLATTSASSLAAASLSIGSLSGLLFGTNGAVGTISTSSLGLSTSSVSGLGTLASLNSVNDSNWLGAPLAVTNGGTGTSTAPALNQLLIGNGIGGYIYVSTSSLGIAGTNYWTSSGGNIFNNTGTNVGIGTTTPGSALTVIGDGSFSGNVFAANVTAGSLAVTNASTTNLTNSGNSYLGTILAGTWNASVLGSNYGGAGSVSGILKANGSGVVSAATAGTDYLAPNGNGSALTNLSASALNGIVAVANGGTGFSSASTSSFFLTDASGNPYTGTTTPAFMLGGKVTGNGQNIIGLNLLTSMAGTFTNATATNATTTNLAAVNFTASGNVVLSAITGTTSCLQVDTNGILSGTGAACGSGGGGGAVNTVSNSDGTLTISPTAGAVVASLALGHANAWTGAQTFGATTTLATTTINGATTLASSLNGLLFATNGLVSSLATSSITILNGLTTATSLSSVGTLTSGSIASGFGNINIGSNTFTGNGSGLTNISTSSLVGVLALANGGTGTSTASANDLLIGNSSGTGWTEVGTSSLGFLSANAIGSGLAGQIPYYAANGSTLTATSAIYISTTTGNVGIGSTSPWSPLTVSGNIDGSSYSLNGTQVIVASTTNSNYFFADAGSSSVSGSEAMSGGSNIAIGPFALSSNTIGTPNIAIGADALTSNTTGGGNVADGYNALFTNVSGSYNTASGVSALQGNNTGSYNTAEGFDALPFNAGGSNDVAEGYGVLGEIFNATNTTAVGYEAGYGAFSSNQNNSLFGYESGFGVSSGSNNVLLGYNAGSSITTGSNNVVLGYNITPANGSNQLDVGNLIYGTGLTSTGSTVSTGSVGIGTTSPAAKFAVAGSGYFAGNLTATGTLNVSGTTTLASSLNGLLFATNGLVSSLATSSITILNGLTTATSLSSVGTLTSGSIASGFGNINIGSNTFTGNGSGLTNISTSSLVGVLALANGGTGTSTASANDLLIGNSSGTGWTEISTSSLGITSSQWTTSGSNIYYNVAGGNVGIGTTTPSALLSVEGVATSTPLFNVASSSNASIFNVQGSGDVNILPAGSSTLASSITTGLNEAWYVSVSGRYAYVTSFGNSSLVIFDVTNPSSPAKISSITTGLNGPVSVTVSGRYAYVASQYNSSLVLFDVSNPASPVEVSSINTGLNGPLSVSVSGRYAYVASGVNNSLVTFDISNPASPVKVSSITTGLSDPAYVTVSGRYAYVASTVNNSLVTFDISNPASPVEVSSINTGLSAPNSVYVSGRYAYVVSESNNSLVTFDVSNPASPVKVGSVSTGLNLPLNVTVSGRYAYVTSFSGNSLTTFDVSNPASPVEVSFVSTGLNGPVNTSISGRYAYVTNFNSNSLTAFDLGGAEFNAENVGSLEAGNLQVRNDITAQGQLQVGGGLNVGAGGIFSSGPLSVSIASSTQTNAISAYFQGYVGIGTTSPSNALEVVGNGFFSGNLTGANISAANLTATGTLNVSGTTTLASSLNGLLFATNGLVSSLATSSITILNGLTTATSLSSVGTLTSGSIASGFGNINIGSNTFTGNGSGLTNISTSSLVGVLALANGGTGTSTASANDLLIGNSSGTGWTEISTSSLGITSSQWMTSGSNIYYNNGNVAIGTSSDSALFSLYGSDASTNLTTGGGVFESLVNANQTNNNFDSLSYRTLNSSSSEVTGTRISGVFTNHTAGSESADLAFLTRNNGTLAEAMRITGAGNVGIGTTTPGSALTVIGNGFFSGNLTAANIAATGATFTNSTTTNATTTNLATTNFAVTGSATTTFGGGVIASCFATSTGGPCITPGSGGAAVSSVSNSDGTLTVSPTSGAVVASLALGHANAWTGQQTFNTSAPIFGTMTQGSIFFAGSGGLLSQNNADFFWDNANNQLDIGTTSVIASNANVGELNVIGTTTATTNLALFRANVNNYAQVALVNANAGATSSADFIVGNNLNDTNSSSYYGDFGINSSGNADANYTGLLPNDTYIYGSDGGLDLGTATSSASSTIRFFTGGLLSADQRMTITSLGYVGIGSTSPSDALDVNGNGNFAGNFTVATTTGTTTIASNLQVNNGSLAYDVPSGVTNIDALQTGALNFDTDAGAVSWADLPLDSTPSAGTIESMSAQVGDTPILTVYGESNGSGGVQNTRVGIGTTTPLASLVVAGMGTDNPFIVASSSGTQYFGISSTGNVGIGTTTPVSVFAVVGTTTIAGNVMPGTDNTYSLGTSTARWSTLYSHVLNTGDVIFGNNFDLLEAKNPDGTFATTTGAGMVWENGTGTPIFSLDAGGNLTVNADVCAFGGTECLGSTWSSLNSLSSQVSALSSTTVILGNVNAALGDQVSGLATASTSIADITAQLQGLNTQVAALADFASSTAAWMSSASSSLAYTLATSTFDSLVSEIASSTASSTASMTAATLSSSSSFIQIIANAVVAIIESMANWTINQITATIGIFSTKVQTPRLETQTAAVTNGIEMTDSATGYIYCVRINSGQLVQTLGTCADTASSTRSVDSVPPVVTTPTVPVAPVTTIVSASSSTDDADSGSTTATDATSTYTVTSVATSSIPTPIISIVSSSTVDGSNDSTASGTPDTSSTGN